MRQDIDQLKNLWKRCFGDPDAFIDLYFSSRYTTENTDLLRLDGKIVAQLQRISYPMAYEGVLLQGDYVSGVCTDADYRNRGLMSRLLAETHQNSFNNGADFAFLIPAEEWLKDYYARFGYVTCFYTQKQTLVGATWQRRPELPRLELCSLPMSDYDELEFYDLFDNMLRRKRNTILHTPDDLRIVLADLQLAGGSIWLGKREGRVESIAFCVIEGNSLGVKELLSTSSRMAESMIAALMEHFSPELMYCTGVGHQQVELGMARIVNVPKILQLYALVHPEVELHISVEGDSFIPSNNGHYCIAESGCERLDVPHPKSRIYGIPELTRLIFGNNPYMSLMMN